MAEVVGIEEELRRVGSDILRLVASHHIGRLKQYKQGSVLYWQGDPVEHIFVVKEGAVKVSSVSRDGRIYTYDILGAGRLVGATTYLLGRDHESMAEAIDDTMVVVISPPEFERVLSNDSLFSAIVMREQAWKTRMLSGKARDLSLLDVQDRLKHTLVRLAREHGLATDRGVKINLNITHEEIGALIAANRTTITACLSNLKKEGYLWTEGRRIVIIPPNHIEILDSLNLSVVDGNDQDAQHWARKAIQVGVDPIKSLIALTSGMKQVDRDFTRGEIDLPDVVLSAYAMKNAIPIVEKEIQRTGKRVDTLGTVVIGTVFGDIHDIGKTLVAMLLKARGFRVVDMGVNVTADQFVRAAREQQPDVLAMSALTTASAPEQAKVIQALRHEGLRNSVKVMVGGGAVSVELAERIGADGYESSAHGAVELAWRLRTWA